MAEMKRIHITDAGAQGGFKISVGATVFRARSLVIEAAPCQPGTLLWMSQASLEQAGNMDIAWGDHTEDLVGFYVDKLGEKVGESLMEYIIERKRELGES